jgi:hypothetical protein
MKVAAIFLINAAIAASACNSSSAQQVSAGSVAQPGNSRAAAALIVMPDAREVSTSKLYDGQVSYQLMEEYPATKSLEFLKSTLAREGFTPLEALTLNPRTPSSHVRGWTNAEIKGQRVYAWSAEWQDSEGNVVSYMLSYSVPLTTGNTVERPAGPLTVQATFLSWRTAETLRKALEGDVLKKATEGHVGIAP